MKLVKKGSDYLIVDNNEQVIGVVAQQDIIDAEKITAEEHRKQKYIKRASNMSNDTLLEAFAEMCGVIVLGKESDYPDFQLMADAVYNEIYSRMGV